MKWFWEIVFNYLEFVINIHDKWNKFYKTLDNVSKRILRAINDLPIDPKCRPSLFDTIRWKSDDRLNLDKD